MLETLPITLRDWFLDALFPSDAVFLRWLATSLVSIIAILAVFGLFFALFTVTERKVLGRFQNRYGPNRTGPFGYMQPFADAVKALTKEDLIPATADKLLHFLAPCCAVFFALLGFAVIPCGLHLTALNLDAGILYFFAAGAATELAIFMAGWSSHNKYSLISAMRALAQLISFELPLLLVAIPAVMAAGTLSLPGIVTAQGAWSLGGLLPHWNLFTPWGLAAAPIFLIAALAETNRCPFDLPEAESEIIAGHLTEYSGFKYALFFMGEYFGMTALAGLGVTLFLGGWQAPCEFLQFIPSYAWFGIKLIACMMLFIWARATLLRLRMDQLLKLAWKFLIPLALLNLGAAALWLLTPAWTGPLLALRWLLPLALVVIPYVLLARRLSAGLGPRTYRYA
ncbi:NADH-quinone oxidoreductase subunit NuoH [Opitutaceae bacterium TAV4]|uniref:NADH-quinone oxidoreductase subunit NuoH n=1 Tax=Geminisphaera colitermitum TaxID=1148786 RepID=UPI000158D3FE|nr:NADH-quinone oxidoreductase subunit NuoH [Geminisphaera colitermitum]RRJ97540.1 NADH-quinone oxidoreductase subunit NuoH [Opitutaceae bacterium TAV4]RRK01915.1 NADH-quinone oxidoreductase subunit NuoH [Opitutaceae bacterium TAV3]